MLQRIVAPGHYLREAGMIKKAGSHCRQVGKKAFIIGGKTALSIVEKDLTGSLEEKGVETAAVSWYGGECCWENIEALAQQVKKKGADFIIGVGGGKALDTAKAVAFALGLPVITIPTIAATCAAWTPLAVVYTLEGMYLELSSKAQNPAKVLVDTEVIAQAPIAFLRAGIGDTLAKWFESEISSRNTGGNAAVSAALSLGNLCYQILLEYGTGACLSGEKGQVSPALEQVVDANIMLSGLVSGLGGDECRTGAAHSIYNGLTVLENAHRRYHGEIVAYGILCQLVLDKKEDELVKLLTFYHKTGLPMTLEELGIHSLSKEEELAVGKASAEVEDMANMPFTVTAEMVVDALYRVDQLGRRYRGGENLV
ncbi:MAG: Iron-containing alcohol dehydrogenase [Peptococcaceae bacterium]|uniref:Iron-containing alcohol dehydrogenase n=1 Tax=Thermanaerosceptrum fracticalcis TaxID=1712410 RepID=A0A7G6E7S8_THEFR|nr:iron-containing alcohol dehydrogenase family protein [Thermanaerosceptrum fracticalcis]MBZ4654506.1 Iron-containing alcohol dehydrogenase [Peptococcaceae bacterium]QNB48132.1 iron-containing alcohol dehydrogenase [Thermanaerosceptrum fracticalcis]